MNDKNTDFQAMKQGYPNCRVAEVNAQPLLLISFSGGRTSAFMTKWIIDNWSNKYKIMVVFANTGKEYEETLEFVDECDKHFGFNCIWVEAITNPINGNGVTAKVVDFKTASRNGEPFESMIAKHGIPNVGNPNCTRELKTNAIRAYAKSIGWKKYYTAIGIRVDEIDRISNERIAKKLIYPLVSDIPTTKNDINKFWRDQPFDLRLNTYQGNCDLCFKKSYRKLMTIVKENQETAIWWAEMERKYSSFIPDSKKHNPLIVPPINFFRQNKSIYEIIEMAKQPFDPAVDESQYKPEYKQLSLYDLYELDVNNGCEESCEVF
jgi:hypothetical protein